MKNSYYLLFISLFIFGNSAHADNRFDGFNKWLFKNGHSEFVTKSEKAKYAKKNPSIAILWYYNKCDKPKYEEQSKNKIL